MFNSISAASVDRRLRSNDRSQSRRRSGQDEVTIGIIAGLGNRAFNARAQR